MKVCIEGPNGIGKTTFIERLMAELENRKISSKLVKLKPKHPYRIITDNSSEYADVFRKDMYKDSHLDTSIEEVKKLVINFLGPRHTEIPNDVDVCFIDRGILSTYIYSIATFQFLVSYFKNFSKLNFFKSDISEHYTPNHRSPGFIYVIMDNLRVSYDFHQMDLTVCLVPSRVNSPIYYRNVTERNKTSTKPITIYEENREMFYNILKMFSDFSKVNSKIVDCMDGKGFASFTREYLRLAGERINFRVKPDFSNSDEHLKTTVDYIVKTIKSLPTRKD